MSWDWDKLQEQKRRQQGRFGGFKPPKPQPPEPDDYDDNDDNDHADTGNKKRFFTLKRGGAGNGGGGNDDAPNLGPSFKVVGWGVILLIAIWLLSGIYIVNPDEAGMVLRFGKYNRTVEPGPHYALPTPIEKVEKLPVARVLRSEIDGVSGPVSRRVANSTAPTAKGIDMLTGDENIVNVQFSVQYKIKDPVLYQFNISGQTEMVRSAAEASMREVIGNNRIESVITDGKLQIQNDAAVLLQALLDSYGAGIHIIAVQFQGVVPPPEVSEAFNDVTNARENKNRFINQAEAYRNELLPKARGEAAAMLNAANAYAAMRTQKAEGDAAKFEAMRLEYEKAPQVTKQRLYYEAMEAILGSATDKILLDAGSANKMLPHMALPVLKALPPTTEKN